VTTYIEGKGGFELEVDSKKRKRMVYKWLGVVVILALCITLVHGAEQVLTGRISFSACLGKCMKICMRIKYAIRLECQSGCKMGCKQLQGKGSIFYRTIA